MPAKGGNRSENLIRRTRKLIDGYPKNSILKEYLQNADDSKATELVVTFDARIHRFKPSNLDFSPAKGPALLIYNNSKFNEQDFDAIVQIGAEESKQNDADATGRFGEGFNSSFSISDHPSFVSNGRAYWFDILREAVSKDANTPDTPYWEEQDFDEIQDWLKTFACTNGEQISKGTIFRLPLRTSETKSKISREVFSRIDFLEWVDEWKSNASHLLFLRHTQKLVLREVDTHGNLTVHLEIITKNKKEIGGVNNEIQNEFKGDFLEICNNWKETGNELPLFKYHHHFEVSHLSRTSNIEEKYDESWAVVNGLFRGQDNCLIKQAIKALEIKPEPRKVWPWAGVAIQLDHNGKAKKTDNSKYFTFLPLPLISKHPIHIHGGFDLNSERNKITNTGAGKDLENLTEWNRLLFREGIGVAWAYLIDFIKESCSPQSYYSIWPKNHEDEFDEYLLEGFYKKINELECFKTKHKQEEARWNTPKGNIYFFQNNSDKKLFGAFKEHFSIISPKPSINIIDGLSNVGTDLTEITPEFIRDYLTNESEELEFPFSLKNMPITMLSREEWLLSILIYCAEAEEGRDYSYLVDLPLELTLDYKVNCLAENKLLDSKPKLPIFKNDESLFLHFEIIEIVKDAEKLPPSWLTSNLENYLTVLLEHVDNYKRENKNWLKSLISMIANSDEIEISAAIDQIYKLEVVYQHDGRFSQLKSDVSSPVLITKEEIPNIGYLAKTGMQLVHPRYVDIYRPLLKWNKYELITDLNSHSLIKHLVHIPENGYEFLEDKDTREYLIDLLAQDITWMEELNDQETVWLHDMPFIATESGNIYAKSEDRNLYLSAGFKPPKHIHNLKGEYEIISIVDDKQHAMYSKMGFDEQNPINYLIQIIIPFIESEPSEEDARNILEWLANNWEELTKDINEDKKEELISTLSESEIVFDGNRYLKRAKNYYHPNFFSDLPSCLQDKKYLPLKFEDNTTQKNWSDFLSKLGASTEIIPEHIIITIQSIAEDENYNKAIELLNYISNHFEWFEEMEYDGKNIFEYLSDLEWLPVEKSENGFLVPEDEYKKLRKPSELILKNDYMIAGGAHYTLSSKVKLGKKDENGDFTEKNIANILGVLVKPSNESVFESFRRLRNTNTQQQEGKVLNFAKEFYKYLGRIYMLEEDIPDDITEKSVFIKGQWLPSSKVFQTTMILTGIFSWDELIANDGKESSLAQGLIKLGVLEQPDNEYLVNYLCKLPKNKKLDKQQLKDAKAILIQLQNNLEELDIDDIPFVSRLDQLITSDKLYIKDLPAYDNSGKRNDQLEFCQQQFDRLAKYCGVVSLAGNIAPDLDIDNSKESEEANNSWNDFIRSGPFKSAVLRLIYHEGIISEGGIEQESLDEILPSQVVLMDSLVVSYSIDNTWIYDDLYTSTYQDTENSILYLLNQDDDEDMCDSIATFISDSSGLNRDNFSLIGRILRHKFDTFEEIHNLLDKKNIKSLPEKIEIDEDVSLYGNSSVTENYGVDVEGSFNSKTEDEQNSSHENHFSTDEDTQSDSNTSNGKKSESKPGEEIPPPTKPKQTDYSNKEGNASSPGNRNRYDHDTNPGGQKGDGIHRPDGKQSSGSNTNQNTKPVSPNDRKPLYVGKETEVDSDKQQEQTERATEIGNRGENYVLERSTNYLLSKSNKFEKAPTNQKGYDILEIDSNGEIIRYIEVKTLTGRWGDGGVAVTESQLEFAQAYDNWWLFVVENINTQNTTVHIFENPVQQANRFMFDHSWKQLSETTKNNQPIVPKEGDKYRLSDGIYGVISIESKGKFYKVRIKETQTGKEVTKKFDPSWEKC